MVASPFTDEELEGLRRFPEIGREELFRFFTLTSADVAFIDPGRGRGPVDRLGLAVTLCTLPWLGFVPDDVASAPPAAVARLADQLGLDPDMIRSYGRRVKTRTEHLRPPEVARQETFDRLAHEFTDERRVSLDGLLVSDPVIGMTRLRWLGKGRWRPRPRP